PLVVPMKSVRKIVLGGSVFKRADLAVAAVCTAFATACPGALLAGERIPPRVLGNTDPGLDNSAAVPAPNQTPRRTRRAGGRSRRHVFPALRRHEHDLPAGTIREI